MKRRLIFRIRFITLIVAYAISAGILFGVSIHAYAQDISVSIDGVELDVEHWDVKPFVQDGEVMVPIRYMAEALGYYVEWKPEWDTGNPCTVVAVKEDRQLFFKPGSQLTYSRLYDVMATPPVIINSRVFISLSSFSDIFLVNIARNDIYNKIIISTKLPDALDIHSEEWDKKVSIMAEFYPGLGTLYYRGDKQKASEFVYNTYLLANDIACPGTVTYTTDYKPILLYIHRKTAMT